MKTLSWIILLIIFITPLGSSQIVNIPDANFKTRLIELGIDLNSDGEIQQSEAETIIDLDVQGYQIESVEGIKSFTNLTHFYCSANMLTELDVNGMQELRLLGCENNFITSLNLSDLPQLTTLDCFMNGMESLIVSDLPNLYDLFCGQNVINDLQLINLPSLSILDCSFNDLAEIDFSGVPNLFDVQCGNNQLEELNLLNLHQLGHVDFVDNSNMRVVLAKTGTAPVLVFTGSSSLEYVCVDQTEIEYVQMMVELEGSDCVVNSYCTFLEGGEVFENKFVTRIDLDGNGCSEQDQAISEFAFKIEGLNNQDIFYSGEDGELDFYLNEGSFTITPLVSDPSKYSVEPESLTLDIPEVSDDIIEFCITPLINFSDLEIWITPIDDARPGFITDYKISIRNKGTDAFSGEVKLFYNETYMDFVESTPSETEASTNLLKWLLEDIESFETRSIIFSMELNTPTEEPPLNDGDILEFNTNVTIPSSDDSQGDNSYRLIQTVVNSFDPNDKTCLQGDYLSIEDIGDFLDFRIRFENTGSAEAVNIVVRDSIDLAVFDINTIELIDASHDVMLRITEPNVLEFIFENTFLPFEDETNDGFIHFRLNTLGTLVLGDEIKNDAEIFFDFNAPIITNETITLVTIDADGDGYVQEWDCDDTNPSINPGALEIAGNGIDEDCNGEDLLSNINDLSIERVRIFPNPASTMLMIEADETMKFEIRDLSGRKLHGTLIKDGTNEISLDHFGPGSYLYIFETPNRVINKMGTIIK